MTQPSMTPHGGLLDGRYEIHSVLGGGASAVVYLARQASVDREVAIKVIRPEVFSNERELERYLREARIVASLNHPNIVTLYDVGRLSDDRPYMVMEYVRGSSLQRLLHNDGYLSVDVAFQVFQQVADALGHAHRHGVVHRDIKPGNILVEHRSTGLVHTQVADFGVASVSNSSLTHHGAFIGTPLYMAPEQALGLPVTPQTDIYALGVVMYRALTGKKLFDADTPVALAMRHVTQPVIPLSEVAPALDIPIELERVVLRCLQKEPGDRYASCEALLQELAEVKVRILPHLLGMSQESLDGPLVLDTRPPPPTRWPIRVAAAVAVMSSCFATGWWVSQLQAPIPEPAVVERIIEHVIEVPVSSELPLGSYEEAPVEDSVAVPAPQAAPMAVQPDMVDAAPSPGVADEEEAPTGLQPRVGLDGLRSRWEGQLDGKPMVLELQSDPEGHLVATLRTRSGPAWSTRDMVGRLESAGPLRVEMRLADLDARQDVQLRATFARDHGWGALVIGGRERSFAVTPH